MKPPFPACDGAEPYIFVCYSHEDSHLVYREISWLAEQGINIWYDEGIPPGEEWPEEIAKAIKNAERVLLFLSPNSVESRVCRDEINFSLAEDIDLLAVKIKSVELQGGLKLSLNSSQLIVKDRFKTVDDYRDQLLASLLRSSLPISSKRSRNYLSAGVAAAILIVVAGLVGLISFQNISLNDADSDIAPINSMPVSEQSIAVLPLVDMSQLGDLGYLGDGLAEELIHELAQIPELNVVARTSSFFFKNKNMDVQEIGRQLGVSTVLEGSIRLADNQLRITLQLIDVKNGFHLWSHIYEREMNDIFQVQEDIAKNVISVIQPQFDTDSYDLLSEIGTENVLAYDAFLIARHETREPTPQAVDRAITQYRIAIELDPQFERAYLGLIRAYDFKGSRFGDQEETMRLAGEVFELAKARILEPQTRDWFWVEQFFFRGYDVANNFEEAEALYNLMIRERSHPANNGSDITGYFQYGILLSKNGLFEAAIDFMEPLELKEPLNIGVKLRLAEFYAAAENYDAAFRKYDELLELEPFDRSALLDKFFILGKLRMLDQARETRNILASIFTPELVNYLDSMLAFWDGDEELARSLVDTYSNSSNLAPSYKAIARLVIGDYDEAVRLLHIAADQDDGFISEIILTQTRMIDNEGWSRLKELDEFKRLMLRYGYDEHWQSDLVLRANSLSPVTGVLVGSPAN